jgi:hypothetical protein
MVVSLNSRLESNKEEEGGVGEAPPPPPHHVRPRPARYTQGKCLSEGNGLSSNLDLILFGGLGALAWWVEVDVLICFVRTTLQATHGQIPQMPTDSGGICMGVDLKNH